MAENDDSGSRSGEARPREPDSEAGAQAAPPGYAGPGGYPAPGQPSYPPSASPPPSRPRTPPLLRPADLLNAVLDAVVPLVGGLIIAVLGLLLVLGAGLSGVSLRSAGPGDYFAAASWLTASSLGTPFGGSFSQSISFGGLGDGSGDTTTYSLTARAAVWLITVLILFLAFRAARARERKSGSRTLAQVFARCLPPAVTTSVVLLILALTTQRSSLLGAGGLLDAGSGGAADPGDALTSAQSGTIGIDTPLVFVGPLLLILAAALVGRISVWMNAAQSAADPQASRLRGQWALWLPSLRVAWLQTRIIVALASVGLWFFVAVEAGRDSNSADHPLVFVLAAIVLILNLGIYGMFAGFGVSLYATVASALGGSLTGGNGGGSGFGGGSGPGGGSGLGGGSGAAYSSSLSIGPGGASGGGAIGILNGEKPWEIWLLLAAAVLGTLAPALLTRLKRPRSRAMRREDYAPGGAWRSAVLGAASALALILLGALEVDGTLSDDSGFGSFGEGASFGPSLLAAMGLCALWFVLAYLALSYSLGHRIRWSGLVRGTDPAAGAYPQYPQPFPGQNQQAYSQRYGQEHPRVDQQQYPGMPAQPQAPGAEQLPPPAAPVESVPVESVSVESASDERAGSVEPLDPSETVQDVVFPDRDETLGDG